MVKKKTIYKNKKQKKTKKLIILTSLLKWLTYKEALVHGLIPWDNGTPLEYPPTILASDG